MLPGTQRHDSGMNKLTANILIANVVAAVDTNPFLDTTSHLMNIQSGIIADKDVKHDLTNVHSIGMKALNDTLDKGTKVTVKLKTFHTQTEDHATE